jgi:cardiolipin synthase
LAGADEHDPARVLNLPNVITLARLCAVPATVWLMLNHKLDTAFIVFLLAGLSDAVDGWLARKLGQQSALGAMMDPVADKALLVSVYILLAVLGWLPDWLAILVVFRDVTIIGGLLLMWQLGLQPPITPLLISKLNSAAQLILAATALFTAGFGVAAGPLLAALIWLAAATTLASGTAYVVGAARLLAGRP